MASLPVVSGREAIRAFEALGYEVQPGRGKGDHVIMKCLGRTTLSVPLHKELAPGTLRNLIKFSGCTVDEFRDLL